MTDDEMRDYVQAIRDCDTTEAEISAIQVCVLHSAILNKDQKLLTSRILGVLKEILKEARANNL